MHGNASSSLSPMQFGPAPLRHQHFSALVLTSMCVCVCVCVCVGVCTVCTNVPVKLIIISHVEGICICKHEHGQHLLFWFHCTKQQSHVINMHSTCVQQEPFIMFSVIETIIVHCQCSCSCGHWRVGTNNHWQQIMCKAVVYRPSENTLSTSA